MNGASVLGPFFSVCRTARSADKRLVSSPVLRSVKKPGESRTYGVQFTLAPGIRGIEATLASLGRPVAVGIPGYVLPADQSGKLFLKYGRPM